MEKTRPLHHVWAWAHFDQGRSVGAGFVCAIKLTSWALSHQRAGYHCAAVEAMQQSVSKSACETFRLPAPARRRHQNDAQAVESVRARRPGEVLCGFSRSSGVAPESRRRSRARGGDDRGLSRGSADCRSSDGILSLVPRWGVHVPNGGRRDAALRDAWELLRFVVAAKRGGADLGRRFTR